jgi:O-antigen ligase
VAVLLAPQGRRLRVYVALAAFCIGAFALTDINFWNRMNTVLKPQGYGTDVAVRARMDLWRVGWAMFSDHPLGVGVGQFREMVGNYYDEQWAYAFRMPRRVPHNTYLLCATELGIQGILVFGGIVLLSIEKARRCIRFSDQTDDPLSSRLLGYGCILSMTVYLTAASFTDRLFTESFWWVLALPICLERALWREVAAGAVAPALLVKASEFYDEDELRSAVPAGGARGSFG